MYLKSLTLKNYRSFDDRTVHFQRGLTVFTGENNSGKSNAIDALRLLTQPLNGRRDLYCESTDVRFGSVKREFQFSASFANLSSQQQGLFLSACSDNSLENAALGLEYVEQAGQQYTIPKHWAGKPGGISEPGMRERIRHVYLRPLRDAKRALASGNPTRILALLDQFLDGKTPESIAEKLGRQPEHEVLTKVDTAVGKKLNDLTVGTRRQGSKLGFASNEKLIDIARDLRFRMADHGISPEELAYSGHGFANLLFIATIAVELERASQAELTLFLVEEPEAHLHPQLQAAVLCFLEDHAEKSRAASHAGGELQVIVATHSPNLTAWIPSENVVVFKSQQMSTDPQDNPQERAVTSESSLPEFLRPQTPSTTKPASSAPADKRPVSCCIPLSLLDLNEKELAKIDRYLDVTKAALLFGGRMLLVEGIAEALVIPAIAKHHVLKGDKEAYRTFRSATFVPIDGVDFQPFISLLLTSYDGARIADKVVVVTDGDKPNNEDEVDDENDQAEPLEASTSAPSIEAPATQDENDVLPGEARKQKLISSADSLGGSQNLAVFVNTYSFESEIALAGNEALVKKAYLKCHPRSEQKWENAVSHSEREKKAYAIQALFETTRKGEFAHHLAWEIENIDKDSPVFKTPEYIRDAIKALVDLS